MTIEDIIRADNDRFRIFHDVRGLIEHHDVLACPVMGNMPRPRSKEWVHEVGGTELTHYMERLRFAFLAAVCGLPVISVPVNLGSRGLTVGLQLIGQSRGEPTLLAAARAVKMATGGPLAATDPDAMHL